MLTHSLIEFMKYIASSKPLSLAKLVAHENKTDAYVRNQIALVNQFLPTPWKIIIKNSQITTAMGYSEFLQFMQSLTYEHYLPSQEERLSLIIVLSYFCQYVNLTLLYETWNISLTTKKSDVKKLEALLAPHQLEIVRKPGAGIRISGNMLRYRVLLITIISRCIDVYDFQLAKREANTPLETHIYSIFTSQTATLNEQALLYIQNFLQDYGNRINYYSKKFFLIYVILALYPLKDPIVIENLQLKPLNLYLFPLRQENIAFNQVVSMIDFDPMMPFPFDEQLHLLVEQLFDYVQSKIKTVIHTKNDAVEELYSFIYRQYFFHYFRFQYDDKLVMNTSVRYPLLYKCMEDGSGAIEQYLDMRFTEQQIASLTLIFSRWISKNRLFGRNPFRIVLMTNIGFERVSYFIEKLKDVVYFDYLQTIDVNELHLLKQLKFDLIITFSDRTSSILRRVGYDSVKVKYFMDHEDVKLLMDAGCSISRRRLIAKDLVNQLASMSPQKQVEFLKTKYETLFL